MGGYLEGVLQSLRNFNCHPHISVVEFLTRNLNTLSCYVGETSLGLFLWPYGYKNNPKKTLFKVTTWVDYISACYQSRRSTWKKTLAPLR